MLARLRELREERGNTVCKPWEDRGFARPGARRNPAGSVTAGTFRAGRGARVSRPSRRKALYPGGNRGQRSRAWVACGNDVRKRRRTGCHSQVQQEASPFDGYMTGEKGKVQ